LIIIDNILEHIPLRVSQSLVTLIVKLSSTLYQTPFSFFLFFHSSHDPHLPFRSKACPVFKTDARCYFNHFYFLKLLLVLCVSISVVSGVYASISVVSGVYVSNSVVSGVFVRCLCNYQCRVRCLCPVSMLVSVSCPVSVPDVYVSISVVSVVCAWCLYKYQFRARCLCKYW
jgi:hypothetical protein